MNLIASPTWKVQTNELADFAFCPKETSKEKNMQVNEFMTCVDVSHLCKILVNQNHCKYIYAVGMLMENIFTTSKIKVLENYYVYVHNVLF